MTSRVWGFAISAPLILTTLSGGQEPGVPPARAAGTGRIAGQVMGAESGRPVRFAEVTLLAAGNQVSVITDEAGGFSFEKLGPGAYRLGISKSGYLETTYGQVRPGTDTPGTPIQLRDREQLDRLVVPLSHGGAISGVVRDDRGEPVFNAQVRASRWAMHNGARVLEEIATTQTDERGAYRIPLLPPRDYVISAAAEDDLPEDRAGVQPLGFAPAYYPAAISAANAETIPLALGEQRNNVDLLLPVVVMAKVTGVVLDADGRPAPGVTVSLADPDGTESSDARTTDSDASGRFTFDRVVPGAYVAWARAGGHRHRFTKVYSAKLRSDGGLVLDTRSIAFAADTVISLERLAGKPAASADTSPAGSGSAELSVGGGTTTDLVLRLEPLRAVSGRVRFDGASPAPAADGIEVALTAANAAGDRATATVGKDGTFVVNVAPGRYVVSMEGIGSPWALASAISGGRDALDHLLDVGRDREVRDLTISWRDRGSELSGVATDSRLQPVAGNTVVVFSTDDSVWPAGSRVRAMNPGADGRFSFRDLRPGSYYLAVVHGLEAEEWRQPQFLRRLTGAAVLVTLADGERKVQDVRVR